MTPPELAARIAAAPAKGVRKVIGLAGPPASGKSTLAEGLAALIPGAQVVPMDGFHLDNAVLEPLGLLPRKGAPQSFDAAGFVALVQRLGDGEATRYPTFDRDSDATVADDGLLAATADTVIVEGNYLLLDEPPWASLRDLFDLTIFLDVPEDVLKERLLQRWLDQGLSGEAALARAQSNDLPNALTVRERSQPADVTIG